MWFAGILPHVTCPTLKHTKLIDYDASVFIDILVVNAVMYEVCVLLYTANAFMLVVSH